MSRPYGSPNVEYRPSPRPATGRAKMVSDVAYEVHARAKAAAHAGGMTMGVYLASLVMRDELDETGCPVWASSASGNTEQIPGLEASTAA